MVRGFSRFVLFLFLGLLRAPTRNSPERVRDTIWTFPEKSGKNPGLETPRFSFSQLIRKTVRKTVRKTQKSLLIRPPLPQCFRPRGRKLRPWSEKNSDQNSDHSRLCIYWGKEKLRPWSEFLGRENSDHGLSFGCFWGRGRRGGSQQKKRSET